MWEGQYAHVQKIINVARKNIVLIFLSPKKFILRAHKEVYSALPMPT